MPEEGQSATIPRMGLFFLLGGILIAAACAIARFLNIGLSRIIIYGTVAVPLRAGFIPAG